MRGEFALLNSNIRGEETLKDNNIQTNAKPRTEWVIP
jgi:hypothetical protein